MHLGLEIFFINKCRFGDLWITFLLANISLVIRRTKVLEELKMSSDPRV